MGGHRINRRSSRLRVFGAGLAATAVGVSLAACGGGESSESNETPGNYRVDVTSASFPTKQRLGQTSLMRVSVRNPGPRTVPALTVTVTIAGKAGETSSLPFGIHDPQPELAQPDRPVWVLSEGFPKRGGETAVASGGATSSSPKSFDFGPLKKGGTLEAVWRLSAVKAGRYTLRYSVEGGLSGQAKAQTAGGVRPGGSFVVDISERSPETEVTDSGEIVEIGHAKQGNK